MACHAASWLRDREVGAGAAPQLGLRTSLEPRRRIAETRSELRPWRCDGRRSPASDYAGIRFTIGIKQIFNNGPAFRTTLVAVAHRARQRTRPWRRVACAPAPRPTKR